MVQVESAGSPDMVQLRARAAAAGIRVGQLLHYTDKAIVAVGVMGCLAVVVKLLTSDEPYWIARRHHELDVYRRFAVQPPPVPAPRLIGHDDRLTILTHLPGRRLHDQRHLTAELSAAVIDTVLDAIDKVAAWRADPPLPEPLNYRAQLRAEHVAGLLDEADLLAGEHILAAAPLDLVTSHGDPLPANILLHGDTAALVDWEHAGQRSPGYDLAVLHTVGARHSPRLADAINARVVSAGIRGAFAVNLALVSCREVRMHRALPFGPVRVERHATLTLHHEHARRQLRAAAVTAG